MAADAADLTDSATASDPLVLRLGPDFVAAWRDAVAQAFRQRSQGPFLAVPSPLPWRAPTWCYVPLLTHTDLTPEEGRRLLRDTGRQASTARCLDAARRAGFAEGEPVTMRVPLAGRTAEAVWTGDLEPRGRKSIRKAQRSGLDVHVGGGAAEAVRFKRLFDATQFRLGSPTLPLRLFDALRSAVPAEFVIVSQQGSDAAALMQVHDGPITWIPWSGSDESFNPVSAAPLMFWHAIGLAAGRGAQVFDFGRSPFGGSTFLFKRQWGAVPVGLAILHGTEAATKPLYARYELAQSLWRRLPAGLAAKLGPWVCRHLADL